MLAGNKTISGEIMSFKQAAIALAFVIGGLSAAQAQMVVPSAGVIPDVAGAPDKPDPTRTYKFVFDVQSLASTADGISPALTGIGRLLNTYRGYGVPADHTLVTAVFHGPTIVLVTKDGTYNGRTGAKENPNKEILRQLQAGGVKLVVCAVSAREQNYTAADLLPEVKLDLSATVTFMELQSRGYVKVER